MTGFGLLFTLIAGAALLVLPRRLAPIPLLVGACYVTMGQKFEVGGITLHLIRILIGVGILRVLIRGERIKGKLNGLDKILIVWAVWAVFSGLFHNATSEGNPIIYRAGLAYNALGIYFLTRIFCCYLEDIRVIISIIAVLLIPISIEMILEHFTGRNMFSAFGAVREAVTIRGDKLRAQGPFMHGILAGTVGAVCFPLMVGLFKTYSRTATLGGIACIIIVFTSNSSGPIMSMLFGVLALLTWRYRDKMKSLQIAGIAVYVLLELVMKAPAYYLIARIDLTGSSTGWHRARLIETAVAHLSEWWLTGTDKTRHWMPTGVSWSPEHTDITNHYLQYGVIGGLPLTLLFLIAIGVALHYVGRCLVVDESGTFEDQFFVWSAGAALMTHAVTCISISYFDQSFVFLYLNLAIISSLNSVYTVKNGLRCGEGEKDIDQEEFDLVNV